MYMLQGLLWCYRNVTYMYLKITHVTNLPPFNYTPFFQGQRLILMVDIVGYQSDMHHDTISTLQIAFLMASISTNQSSPRTTCMSGRVKSANVRLTLTVLSIYDCPVDKKTIDLFKRM